MANNNSEPLIRGNLTVSLQEYNDRIRDRYPKRKPRNVVHMVHDRAIGLKQQMKPRIELVCKRRNKLTQNVYIGLNGDRVAPIVRETWKEGPYNWPLIKQTLALNNNFADDGSMLCRLNDDGCAFSSTQVRDYIASEWKTYRRNKLMLNRYKFHANRTGDMDNSAYFIRMYHMLKRSAKVNLVMCIQFMHSYRVPDNYMLDKRVFNEMDILGKGLTKYDAYELY